jgi:ferredoxin
MDRKTFFSKAFTLAVGKALTIAENPPLLEALERCAEEKVPKKASQRLPGSLDEKSFVEKCTGCDACMQVCPVNAVMIEDMDRRLPLIYPKERACVHCEDYPCIASCETGALSLDEDLSPRWLLSPPEELLVASMGSTERHE